MRWARAWIEVLGRRPYAADATLAAALVVLAAAEISFSEGPNEAPRLVLFGAALTASAALAWRRRAPFAAAFVALATITVFSAFWRTSGLWIVLVAVIAMYSVAAYGLLRPALVAAVVWVVGGALATAQESNRSVWQFVGNYVFLLAFLGLGPWLVGRAQRRRQLRAAVLEDRAAAAARDSRELAQAAVAEERLRIARELHDVVGHALGVIVVQAGAERATLSEPRASTHETLLTIEHTGRDALSEMRRLLELMRRDDETVALAPQPSLARLPALVEKVRAAGLPVEAQTEGEPRALPAGVDLSAYRIVQEALTNALKHASPARARVLVRFGEQVLELEITDDGPGPATERDGAGHGLIGMRERVALHHGSMRTGARPEGGYAVTVRLPYQSAR
jgi:signal transduction histidine kinase